MDTPSQSLRDRARRLLAASQTASHPGPGAHTPGPAHGPTPETHTHEAVVVSEKLRIPLTRFAGAEGFASLLRRALVLASAEVPSLQSVKIGADGRLEGFEQLAADTGDSTGGEGFRGTGERGARGARRRSRSQRICSGCWSPSSANPSR